MRYTPTRTPSLLYSTARHEPTGRPTREDHDRQRAGEGSWANQIVDAGEGFIYYQIL